MKTRRQAGRQALTCARSRKTQQDAPWSHSSALWRWEWDLTPFLSADALASLSYSLLALLPRR